MNKEQITQAPNPSQLFGQSLTSAILEKAPKERSIFGLAAELKNTLRGDQVYRSERTHRFELRNKKTAK